MAKEPNFDRRQFVRKTFVAGAAAVATTVVTRSTKGCPIFFDENGNRQDYWCVIEVDATNPHYTIYTWKNCNTGEIRHSLGSEGNIPLGDCGDAEDDPSCFQSIEIGRWGTLTIGKTEYMFKPKDAEVAKLAARMMVGKN